MTTGNPTNPNIERAEQWREQANSLTRQAGFRSRDEATRLMAKAEQLRACADELEAAGRWYFTEDLGAQAREAGKVRAVRCKTCSVRYELASNDVPDECPTCPERQVVALSLLAWIELWLAEERGTTSRALPTAIR